MTDLVRYSRAGDEFHYRWAARRCLRMIEPNSKLKCIVIEGSKDPNLSGEYVMDVTEYSESENKRNSIAYFQLKHSTVRANDPFSLSDLQGTIEGFARRFREHISIPDFDLTTIQFSIITNRPFSDSFKSDIIKIRNNEKATEQFQKTLEKYTTLNGDNLQKFCNFLELIDTESNYIGQKYDLQCEMAAFFTGNIERTEINDIITLIREEALPDAKRKILPEDILSRFGITSKQELFPAPPEFEILNNPIQRAQYTELLNCIIQSYNPIIIHAAGGVGKSVAACQLASSFPNGSVGIVYDSFGGGTYRHRSKPRHRYRDALVQIVNELAMFSLCTPLIPRTTDLDDALLKTFLNKIKEAGNLLQQANENAFLVIFIDAADNAEMAATQFSESCFVKYLLRETVPDNCRIVALCRTERIDLLEPKSNVQKVELLPFSETETLDFLRQYFPNANTFDANELHRLTAGNPRVQNNAISFNKNKSIAEVLNGLGSLVSTVDDQIAIQLNQAIDNLKENHTKVFQSQIDAICLGLANLQPFIPIEVLATAAEVDMATIRSFIADLGRPLWLTDNFVQFRDEPTETWFREKFSATTEELADYVNRLKPLAIKFPYVAEILPSLLLQSDNYNQLIELAFSDESLPEDSPIDKRNIRIYRLQFAFKAALKQKNYADAAKLAFLSGEEVAGDKRQLELLSKNVDLIEPLQSKERVQQIAFRRLLSGAWTGSENVYSASLLSTVQDFKGEARNHLRIAENWLNLHFEERKKDQDNFYNDRLHNDDIVELVFAHFNLFGSKAVVQFILNWKPSEVIFRITGLFVKRLIDAGNFSAVDKIFEIGCRNLYLILAITNELVTVGRFPPATTLNQSLILLCHKRTRINKLDLSTDGKEKIIPAIISFSETCVAHKCCHTKILRVLSCYSSSMNFHSITTDYGNGLERYVFLRSIALKVILSNELNPDLNTLVKDWQNGESNYEIEQNIKKLKEVIGSLLPWHIARTRALTGDAKNFDDLLETANKQSKQARTQRYQQHDCLPFEISQVHFEALAFNAEVSHLALDNFIADLQSFRLSDRLNAVRTAFRLPHLSRIKNKLEQSCYASIKTAKDEYVETRANEYIELARAVLCSDPEEAKVYFDEAIEVVSKFGDEIVERWEAVVAIAERAVETNSISAEMAYRFIRCAELVGDNVAREKYFDRNKAIEVCFKLHPASAFSALSRWLDRDVGCLDKQLPALAQIALKTNIVAPAVVWSLSAFSWKYDFVEFAVVCLEKETDAIRRQYILNSAARKLRLENTNIKTWKTLNATAQRFSLKNPELERALDFYFKNPKARNEKSDLHSFRADEKKDTTDWNSIFVNLELTDSKGLDSAIDNFNAMSFPYHHHDDDFWQEVFNRVPENKANQFLKVVVNAENVNSYNIQSAFSKIPETWREKASVQRAWSKAIKTIARRFAIDYTDHYRVTSFLESIQAKGNELQWIHEGVLEGLSDSCYLVNESTLFGFANVVSSKISPQEAHDLLDFSLGRFEKYIDSSYGDGNWANWMKPPDTITGAFSGFVWAALGSPRSEIRWRAVHCVRKLAEMGCESEVDALINWMNQDSVGAFGCQQYPFYNLHARLYLLIAIARVAIDDLKLFKKHHTIFEQYALYGISHALIQKYATDIALLIEKAFPNIYTPEIIQQLHQINISQFPIQKFKGYGNRLESPWHIRREIDTTLNLYFSYDFGRYWFEPLGRVFGISAQQIEELAREILLNEWNLKTGSKYIDDPRSYRDHERETWHSHYSYPRTDNYSFYLSYHAMLSVAAKLLKEMPVVHSYDWEENEWLEWLHKHCLTRTDGRWLADRRDPAPLLRRTWIDEKKSDDWRWEVTSEDFLDALLLNRDGETWLNVNSSWHDNDNDGEESFYISSVLVSPKTSLSLLNTLTLANNYHYKLPNYPENNIEIETFSFELEGWIYEYEKNKGLDQFDPYAGDIYYPCCQIGKSFIEKFGLITDLEQREWYLPNETKASLVCELWDEKISGYKDQPARHGNRLIASLDFLKKLCIELKLDLIIEVQIRRNYLPKSYNRRQNDDIEYSLPYQKIYVLSGNGTLKDARIINSDNKSLI